MAYFFVEYDSEVGSSLNILEVAFRGRKKKSQTTTQIEKKRCVTSLLASFVSKTVPQLPPGESGGGAEIGYVCANMEYNHHQCLSFFMTAIGPKKARKKET